MDKNKEQNLTKLQVLVRWCQNGIISSLEKFFTWYGKLVATYPWTSIFICIIITVGGGLGLLRFYEEGDAARLVIPPHSDFRRNIDWIDNNYPHEVRVHSIVYTADNVLTPEVIKTIYKQRKMLNQLSIGNKTFDDLCIKVPILKFPDEGFWACNRIKKGQTTPKPWADFADFDDFDDEFDKVGTNSSKGKDRLTPLLSIFSPMADVNLDMLEQWSNDFYPELYCGCLEATETACLEQNIVELWADQGSYNSFADEKISELTYESILDTINNNNVSQVFLKDFNFTELLGDIKYNSNGEIIGAGAVEIKFYTTVNITDVNIHGTAARGEKIDKESFEFEGILIDNFVNRTDFPQGVTSFVNIQRQFFDGFVGQTFKDVDKLVGGYILVFVYVNLMLSKMNFVEQRVGLSIVGILSVFMGMILGYGICSLFGLFYSAAHTIIPFILLGIGIDNIFVITQTFNTLETSSNPATLPERFGQTMKHAGVAVSVTTFTDVIAFFIGSNTVLPGLQSFCIYAAVAIFAIYALQVTHFVAWLSLDVRRQNSHRDGCICCYVHKNFKSFDFSKGSWLNKAFRFIGNLLLKKLVQVIILTATVGFLVGGIWGIMYLQQEYQPQWLLPPESEISKWFYVKERYFPSAGEPGFIMIKKINIAEEFGQMEKLVSILSSPEQKWNLDKVSPWNGAFRSYINNIKNSEKSFEELMKDEAYFRDKFTQFLFSPRGAIFQANFWFAEGEKLKCGEPAPDVMLQALPYSHKRFGRSAEWIPAMREIQRIVRDTPFSNDSFALSIAYINWETDAIVGIELIRNIGIALACIFVTTLVTLGSWRGSMLVMMCVLLTCTDVAGFMHWWGLTIDITSMNVLIISVGLCVDFCAHIVHGFLTGHGTKEEKVLFMMENIAPAVLNGGFSTLLALSLLATSKSHVAMSFFKIFFMICIFGLFHGLILLPTVLCMIGPSDEDMIRHNSKRKSKENGHSGNGLVPNTDKYQKENELNIKSENAELQVPLNQTKPETELEDAINDNYLQFKETRNNHL